MKILLADDSMTAQNMGKKILTDAGFEVIAVSNGAAALKKITAENPDIIILDVFMPGYTGLEVCERLKNNPETSRKPVLLTVGKMEPFNPDDSNRVRAEGVMIKPFEATDLTAAVEAIAKRFNIQKTVAPPPPSAAKIPQNHRSYEETVLLSQDELRKTLGIAKGGIANDGVQETAAASAPAVASAAVAVAAPALELGIDSSAIVTEQPEIKVAETMVPAMELDAPSKPAESEPHSPFSHASVAREVVEHPPAPVRASEAAAWDPVLDGIAIPSTVITPEPEAAQAAEEAQPMFGLEYAAPASVAQETPAPEILQEEAAEPVAFSPVQSIEPDQHITSPSAYLAEASAAMGLETSHAIVEEEPIVEAAPDFEPNVAPPVQVETHAENGVEPGIEQPSPELTVLPDPALVGGTESFSAFTTHFGVENAEVIPVGIVPELLPDASSSYEYQPPEEGHAFDGDADAEAVAEPKSEDVSEAPVSVAANSTPNVYWDMVPVEAAPQTSPTAEDAPAETAVRDEPATLEAEAKPTAFSPGLAVSQALIEDSTPAAEANAVEAAEKPFDPDATQALPDEFFTSSEPQLETTAELVGASIPEPVSENVVEPEPEPTVASVEEATTPSFQTTYELEPEPVAEAPVEPVPLAPVISSISTEPAILSVGPEPPSIEEPMIDTPHIEQHTSLETPVIAAAAAAGASVLGAAIIEHLHHASEPLTSKPPTTDSEIAPGDQTQVFIASAVARVLDRMKPTLIEEIAREMSNRRKPRKDPEE